VPLLGDDNFIVRFEPPSGRVCVIVPATKRDPTGCAGLDVDKLAAQLDALPVHPLAAVRVRDGARNTVLMITREPEPSHELTKEEQADWLSNAREGAADQLGKGADVSAIGAPVVRRIHGSQVIEGSYVVGGLSGDPRLSVLGATRIVAVPTKAGCYELSFSTDREHESDLKALVDATMATVDALPPLAAGEHKSEPFRAGYAAGTWVARIGFTVLVAGLFLLAYLSWRKRRLVQAASAAPRKRKRGTGRRKLNE
jgi:hypothetical protein